MLESILRDESSYRFIREISGYKFYMPVSIENGYHLSRFAQIQRQALFARCGATPEVLRDCMDAILDLCNKEMSNDRLRTDIAGIAEMVKYRTDFPIDEHCSIRLGSLLCFIEWEHDGRLVSEDPDKLSPFFFNKKVDLALNNPDVYDFFLHLGIMNTDVYKEHWSMLEEEDYFLKRMEVIRTLSRIV